MNKQINCLDNGFVRLVDMMGDDTAIVQAARVSYGEGTKTVREDENLIRYLMRNSHTSPFEMVEYKFHIKCPIFVARQWVRHRTASINEYSGRYSEMKNEFYLPEHGRIQTQNQLNKQGSGKTMSKSTTDFVVNNLENLSTTCFDVYDEFIDLGVSRELARINLPLSTYTEFYWKIDLHNLLNFLRLRMDDHAQFEIREFANAIGAIVEEKNPITWRAFNDYILEGVKFSKQEIEIIREFMDDINLETPGIYVANMNRRTEVLSKTEKEEFLKKLKV